MHTTALTRSAIDSSRNTAQDDGNGIGDDARPAGKNKGFVHLLNKLTLEAVLAQPHDDYQRACVQSFLVDGVVPCDQDDLDYLALWTVRNAEGDVLNALLGLRPLVVPMNDVGTASGLLAAMQSGLSFSGLTLQLDTTMRKQVLDAVIPLLTQAFSADASLAALVLFSNDYGARGLQPLFDALAGVKDLQLITVEERLQPDDVAVIATLLSKNKTVRALELNNLGAEQAGAADAAGADKGMADLFRHLCGQSHLERLVLSEVPEHCQSLLGNFLGSSNTLTTLRISMDGVLATEPLVAGFRRNTSVEKLYLNVTDMADGLLPLLAALADSENTLTHVTLTTRQGRADAKDSRYIGNLIARSGSLASLVWGFADGKGVDLGRLGIALEKNRRLESLTLIRLIEPEARRGPVGHACDWVDTTTIPPLLESLNKNRTLTALVFSERVPLVNAVPEKFPMLQQVLDRNRAWQVFACSDAYICGAAQGFFTSLGMPVDTALVTADCLLHYKPRVAAGALALVNKATYYSALAGRRDAHPAMLNQRLAAMPDYEDGTDNFVDDMIELLNGIIASRGDYSAEDLRRIANSPSLGAALVAIMERSTPNYLYLGRRFCQAVGTDVMRSKVLSGFSNPLHVNDLQLKMLDC
jgi:hypothetical protein